MELVCSHCKASKPTTEFHRASTKRGYQTTCKACKAQHQRDNADAHLASGRKSYAKNIDKERERSAAKHRKDPSKALARSRKHVANNRDHVNAQARRRRQANLEEARKKDRAWKKAHPESCKRSRQRWVSKRRSYVYAVNNARRILVRHALSGEPVDLDVLYKRDKGICQLCLKRCTREDASRDHVIPISEGGEHSYKNCVLAHLRCNSSKGNRKIAQQQRLF